jgi:hypothetical protein
MNNIILDNKLRNIAKGVLGSVFPRQEFGRNLAGVTILGSASPVTTQAAPELGGFAGYVRIGAASIAPFSLNAPGVVPFSSSLTARTANDSARVNVPVGTSPHELPIGGTIQWWVRTRCDVTVGINEFGNAQGVLYVETRDVRAEYTDNAGQYHVLTDFKTVVWSSATTITGLDDLAAISYRLVSYRYSTETAPGVGTTSFWNAGFSTDGETDKVLSWPRAAGLQDILEATELQGSGMSTSWGVTTVPTPSAQFNFETRISIINGGGVANSRTVTFGVASPVYPCPEYTVVAPLEQRDEGSSSGAGGTYIRV